MQEGHQDKDINVLQILILVVGRRPMDIKGFNVYEKCVFTCSYMQNDFGKTRCSIKQRMNVSVILSMNNSSLG